MKKVLWAVLAVLLLVSCGGPVKAEPETSLELKVENLEGKWVLEGGIESYLFNGNTYTRSGGIPCSYEILNEKINFKYKDGFGNEQDDIKTVFLYRSYILIDGNKYIKQK